MTGRRPKPVSLKMLQGNPGGRSLAKTDAPFEAGAPEKPSWFNEEAAAEWDRLVARLGDESGVLSPAHFGILTTTCLHYAQFREADLFIQQHGSTYESVKGDGNRLVREYPQVRQRHDALQAYRKCLNDLGATPTQAPRVQRLPQQQELFEAGLNRLLG